MLKKVRLALVMVVALAMVLAAGPALAADQTDQVTLQIVSVSDFHGALVGAGKNPGAAKWAQFINETKAQNPAGTILLSAGDMFQGSADSNLMFGKPVVDIMNALHFDAMAIGNHEFDWGIAVLKDREAQSKFPYLSANIVNKKTGQPADFAKPYVILEKNGVKVGVIGITTPETAFMASPKVVGAFEFSDPVKAVNNAVATLRKQGVEVIIVLSHLAANMDSNTQAVTGDAANLAAGTFGVDAVVAGHSHLKVVGMVNNVPVVEVPYNGRAVAKITLVYSKSEKRVVSAEPEVVTLPYNGLGEDSAVKDIVAKGQAELAPIKNVIIGETAGDLNHDKDQLSVLGSWLMDATRQRVNADIAFDTGGDIRTGIPAGKITMGQLYEVMPFDNTFYTVDLTGTQVKQVLEYGLYNKQVGMLQFSGLKVKYDASKPQGQRVVEVTTLKGEKLDANKLYRVVTNDYLFDGGDGYTMFKQGKNAANTFLPVRETYADEIKKAGRIHFTGDERLIEVSGLSFVLLAA